jgi:hypothetical protein
MHPGPNLRAVLFNATERNGHHGCALVAAQTDKLAKEAGIDVVARLDLGIPSKFDERAGYDMVLVNGEGSVHHDQPAAMRVANVGRFFRRIGKPAYLINASYEANGPRISEGVACFRLIYVRDTRSRDELAKLGIAATVVPDLSLTWQCAPVGVSGNRLVVVDSVQNSVSAGLYALAQAHAGRYFTIKAEPPVLRDFPDRNQARRAKYFLRRGLAMALPQGWRREKLRPSHPSFDSFITALTDGTALIISGRFHGVCMALVLEVPVLGLRSNTSKIEALLADIGLANRTVAGVDEAAGILVTSATNASSYSATDLDRIRAFRRRALADARIMFETIRDDVRAPASKT